MFRSILLAVVILAVLWAWNAGFMVWPDDGVGVALELKLEPAKQVVKFPEWPTFKATLSNHSKRLVRLVEPGGGSSHGARTPILDWSAGEKLGRCGNMDPLRRDEIFRLLPDESRQLMGSLGSRMLSPGTYNLKLTYTNEPSRRWSGILSWNEFGAMRMVRASTPATVVSNVVEVVVEE